MMSILGKVTKLIHHSLDQGVELQDLWRVILKHRWTEDILKSTSGSAHCLNTAQAENVVERIEAELNIVDTKDFDPDKYLPEVLEAFSLLYFCPPHHLVEAVKL